ncbi:MAG: Replicative DNA helicase [Firmicutes bacterium ADurb.Bin099]|nr:MAG: Replicative DNA helicase [Firmicutes bacterium ADurb.Bin099]
METKRILEEIYLRLNREEALRDLEPTLKGDYIELLCPSCKKRRAFIYKNGITIKCNRTNDCGYKQSLWDYIQGTKKLDNQGTLRELAKLSGYNLPEGYTFNEAKYIEEKTKEDLLEKALSLFKSKLIDKDGAQVLAYLRGRGYSEQDIIDIDLGFIPPPAEIIKYLKAQGYKEEAIRGSGLLTSGFGETHSLAIPSRDFIGKLQGFIVRSILTEEELKKTEKPKYLYNAGLKRGDYFFNIDRNLRDKSIIIVEGYLDALLGTLRGLEGIVSAGANVITENQLNNAIKYGATSFILALDNDKAGTEGTERALRLIQSKGLKGYVSQLPEGYKDPEELIMAKGIDALNDCLSKAEPGIKWQVKRLLSKHSKQSKQLTDIERDATISEALRLSETLTDPLDSKDLIDTLSGTLEIPLNLLAPKFEDYQKQKAREKQLRGYRELQDKANKLLTDGGDLEKLDNLFRDYLQSIKEQGIVRQIQPYSLEAFINDTKNKKPGLNTGYKELDKLITIPQEAITIIAGRPSHGKTTLLLNLFLNMTGTYKDKRFFFFSYEENTQKLALKCIKILSNKEIDLELYIKNNNSKDKEIEGAKKRYSEYASSGRLWIIYEPYYIGELTDTIDFLSKRYSDIGAIFIDYIQKIKIKGSYSTRQLELQKISAEILETANRDKLPIILGAQFNREVKTEKDLSLSALREAGDIEQDANLVLGLFNKDFEDNTTSRDNPHTAKLTVKILKNRDGQANKEVTLELKRAIQKISDSTEEC